MAEGFLRHKGGDRFDVESAGITPGSLNPFAVRAMKEVGIDISGHRAKGVQEIFKQGKPFDYVVTVCDDSAAHTCPYYPAAKEIIHWAFPDPSVITGSDENIMLGTGAIRDAIGRKVEEWMKSVQE